MDNIFGLSEESEALLQHTGQVKHFRKKEFLLREGQRCKNIWFILEGLTRKFYNKEGKEINLDFILERNFVTQLESLRSNIGSNVYIQAVEPTTALEFEREQLSDLYDRSKEIAGFGRAIIEQLWSEQEAHANRFKILSPPERYQYIIDYRPELMQRVSLTQLASYLGISRETLSRLRKY